MSQRTVYTEAMDLLAKTAPPPDTDASDESLIRMLRDDTISPSVHRILVRCYGSEPKGWTQHDAALAKVNAMVVMHQDRSQHILPDAVKAAEWTRCWMEARQCIKRFHEEQNKESKDEVVYRQESARIAASDGERRYSVATIIACCQCLESLSASLHDTTTIAREKLVFGVDFDPAPSCIVCSSMTLLEPVVFALARAIATCLHMKDEPDVREDFKVATLFYKSKSLAQSQPLRCHHDRTDTDRFVYAAKCDYIWSDAWEFLEYVQRCCRASKSHEDYPPFPRFDKNFDFPDTESELELKCKAAIADFSHNIVQYMSRLGASKAAATSQARVARRGRRRGRGRESKNQETETETETYDSCVNVNDTPRTEADDDVVNEENKVALMTKKVSKRKRKSSSSRKRSRLETEQYRAERALQDIAKHGMVPWTSVDDMVAYRDRKKRRLLTVRELQAQTRHHRYGQNQRQLRLTKGVDKYDITARELEEQLIPILEVCCTD
jgi:hypothetical protein